MRKLLIILTIFITSAATAQLPCSALEYRQFDFWLGEWEVFGVNGKKAGDSRISVLLDSCVILEEWTSANITKGIRYSGKSFNTYDATSKQWQQTWVDNVGGSTEYLKGRWETNRLVFSTHPFPINKDTLAVRQLSFTNLGPGKVRQLGEISRDGGATWTVEYDLEYRRRK